MEALNAITGGVVSVEDGIKASEEYAPARKVRVELQFDIASSSTDVSSIIELVSARASQQVAILLGRATSEPVRVQIETAAATPPKRGRGRPPKETPAETTGNADLDAALDLEAVTNLTTEELALRSAEDFDPTAPIEPAPTPTEDALDLTSGSTAPITDADLNAAVQKKNATLNDPPKIRDLIGSFNPDKTKAFQLREIPAGQRPLFLEKLEALA